MAKDKIAICFSGQTRHFNENRQYTNDFYEILELFDDYDYDLFGHTWADHKFPHGEIKQRFKECKRTDQELVWDNILNNTVSGNGYTPTWEQFFRTNEEWFKKPEYMDILSGKSDVSYIDFAKERIKGTVGQVWSAHESFLLTKPYFESNNYVAVIKLRWDLMIKRFEGEDWVNTNKERFKNMLSNWINKEVDFGGSAKHPSCLSVDDCIITERSTPYVNDHLFAWYGEEFSNTLILTSTPVEFLSRLLLSYMPNSYTIPHLPSAHTLWMDWILHAGFTVSPKLPNIFQANGPSEGKINKEWNI